MIHLTTPRWQALIFLGFALFFWMGRSIQVTDSQFTVLLGHSLIENHSTNLRPYLDHPILRDNILSVLERQIIRRDFVGTPNERWVMLYPQLPGILAAPLTLITDRFYPVVVGNPPRFHFDNELRAQIFIAALLCAGLSLLLFRIALLWLPPNIALLSTIALIVGSSVTSTLSRAIWSDTMACLLIMSALHHLAQVHLALNNKEVIRPIYLATLLSLAFACKPIYAIPGALCVFWALWLDRKKTVWLIGVGALLVLGYFAWSLALHGTLLTRYDNFRNFNAPRAIAFFGVLISPGRGIFIFWSWLIFIIAAFILSRRFLMRGELFVVGLGFVGLGVIIAMLSCFDIWHGTISYGPRLQIPALPWLMVISLPIFRAFLVWIGVMMPTKKPTLHSTPPSSFSKSQQGLITLGMLCLLWSMFVNTFGMMQPRSFIQWHDNAAPSSYDPQHHWAEAHVWNWQDPIFLAGIVGRERYANRPNPYQ